jgi:hypothetical protein
LVVFPSTFTAPSPALNFGTLGVLETTGDVDTGGEIDVVVGLGIVEVVVVETDRVLGGEVIEGEIVATDACPMATVVAGA